MYPGKKNFILFLVFIIFCLQGFIFSSESIVPVQKNLGKISLYQEEEDYLFTGKESVLLIGASARKFLTYTNYPLTSAKGSILAFLPLGINTTSEITAGAPVMEFGKERIVLNYSEISLPELIENEDKLTIKLKAYYSDEKGRRGICETIYRYFLNLNQVKISSTVKNTGDVAWEDFNYSLYFNSHQRYRFSPSNEGNIPNLNFTVYPKNSHYLAWLEHSSEPQSNNSSEKKLMPGKERKVSCSLFVDKNPEKLLSTIYKELNTAYQILELQLESLTDLPIEVLIEEPATSNIFFRSFVEEEKIRIPLPHGVYKLRTHFFPAVTESFCRVNKEEEARVVLKAPPTGKLNLKIKNSKGNHVPGKVSISGISPTPTPYFRPINPRKSGRNWEEFKNSCFPSQEGIQIELPAGVYLMTASRGPEYSLDKKILEVVHNKDYDLTFTIDKVINLKNLISLDPHLHTIYSDGRVNIEERIKSIAAEGIDVAVSSDHNIILDYATELNKLGLDSHLEIITGNEITHGNVIHFNAYPLEINPEEELNGAINPEADEASLLFESNRAKNPNALIQVNHPRSGNIGYFNNYCLDPENASFARKNFDTSFEIMEVMNGPLLYESNAQTINDWFNLLNKGYRIFAVGSSDSHTIDKGEPGYSRTYVYLKNKTGKPIDMNVFLEKLKNGRSFVTNGPLVDLRVNSKGYPGDLIIDKDGKVKISITVQAAPWISVREARIVLNGKREKTIPISFKNRKIKWIHEDTINLEEDTWIAVEILGDKSLFPVVQRLSYNGTSEKAAFPYAVTNPVFIDIDGNGCFDAPWPMEIKEITQDD